jgi:hypothetical protein
MRINPRAFGIATGLTAAFLFLVCAVFVAVLPDATTAFFGTLIHADLSAVARPLSLSSFVIGLIVWTVGTGLTFGLAAAVYNRLIGVPRVVPAAGYPAAGRV